MADFHANASDIHSPQSSFHAVLSDKLAENARSDLSVHCYPYQSLLRKFDRSQCCTASERQIRSAILNQHSCMHKPCDTNLNAANAKELRSRQRPQNLSAGCRTIPGLTSVERQALPPSRAWADPRIGA
ncbi:unnamed protein product [Cercospora beticola]|nr:unnamed protein product [Cercospora beticola]